MPHSVSRFGAPSTKNDENKGNRKHVHRIDSNNKSLAKPVLIGGTVIVKKGQAEHTTLTDQLSDGPLRPPLQPLQLLGTVPLQVPVRLSRGKIGQILVTNTNPNTAQSGNPVKACNDEINT